MTTRKALLLGLAAFLLALLIVLPASWMGAALPESIRCTQWGGSIWRGQCRELTLSNGEKVVMKLTSLQWKLKPGALLRLSVGAEFHSDWPQGEAAGHVQVKPGGHIVVRDMSGSSQLDQRFFGALPQGWQGHIDIRDFELDWSNSTIGHLGGELVVANLVDRRGLALGGYRLAFPPASTSPYDGELTDTGGPVEVQARVQFTSDQSWTLEGRMRARNPDDVRLAQGLDMLSSPDSSGWRRLSAAGQFR
jgi:hypothetical protein